MAKIFPFRAFHYNTRTVTNLSDVITPPYDVIPEGDVARYRARSPYNFAHVDLAHGPNDDYSRSKELLDKWKTHQIVVTDNQPGYYLYRQTFQLDGQPHTRDTLMCTVELSEFADGKVRPHENTFGKYKTDRLQIMRQTKSNLSHIFGMVKDPEGFLNALYERWEFQAPLLKGNTDDGVQNAVWKLDAAKVPELAKFFEDKPIYIVDGHHRYESALAYARETGTLGNLEKSASKMLFAIANAYDPGLVVLPTHRVLRGIDSLNRDLLEKRYALMPFTFEDLKQYTRRPHNEPSFCVFLNSKLYLCTPKHWEDQQENLGRSLYKLSVHWSDRLFMPEICGVDDTNRKEKVEYVKDLDQAWEMRDKASVIVFHAPPAISEIMDVADEKKFMPQKSTYFFPKLAAGLIMRDISN